jgi:hypothetical protein
LSGGQHLIAVRPVAHCLCTGIVEPLAQRHRHRRGRVADRVRETGRTEDVVEMVMRHDQVGDIAPGQLPHIIADCRGLQECRATVDQQHTGITGDHADRDVEKRKSGPVHAVCEFLPVVMHRLTLARLPPCGGEARRLARY